MPRKYSKPRASTGSPDDSLVAGFRHARQVRDEFANSAWALFMLQIECALADEAAREAMERTDSSDAAGPCLSRRQTRRFVVEVLKGLPSLFWGMLWAVSFPAIHLLLMLVVSTVVNLMGAALVVYFIYLLLTVW